MRVRRKFFFFFLERFTDSEVVRCELELSEVREACVSESEMRRE